MYSSMFIVHNFRLLLQAQRVRFRYYAMCQFVFHWVHSVNECVFNVPFMMCTSCCGNNNIQRIAALVKIWVTIIRTIMLHASCSSLFWNALTNAQYIYIGLEGVEQDFDQLMLCRSTVINLQTSINWCDYYYYI